MIQLILAYVAGVSAVCAWALVGARRAKHANESRDAAHDRELYERGFADGQHKLMHDTQFVGEMRHRFDLLEQVDAVTGLQRDGTASQPHVLSKSVERRLAIQRGDS